MAPFADLALFELKEPINVNDTTIRPVCLPDPRGSLPHRIQFFGYGMTGKSFSVLCSESVAQPSLVTKKSLLNSLLFK